MSAPPTGSAQDILIRLKAVLPLRWFPDDTPVLDALLAGLANGASTIYAMVAYVRLQTRIATATDTFLDVAASDYCATRLTRRLAESDTSFRVRVERELLRERATSAAVAGALSDTTGRVPAIFEPARPAGVGGYGGGGGWGTNLTYGNANLPFQTFVTAYQPLAPGAQAAPSLGPGSLLADSGSIAGPVTDAEIYAAVAQVMPIGTTAWTAIVN